MDLQSSRAVHHEKMDGSAALRWKESRWCPRNRREFGGRRRRSMEFGRKANPTLPFPRIIKATDVFLPGPGEWMPNPILPIFFAAFVKFSPKSEPPLQNPAHGLSGSGRPRTSAFPFVRYSAKTKSFPPPRRRHPSHTRITPASRHQRPASTHGEGRWRPARG
jgi:hypothetical protein